MSKRFLVSGGGGFVGSHLVDDLVEDNCEVVVIDNFVTGSLSNLEKYRKNVTVLKEDICITDLAGLGELDGIFHLAAQTSVPLSIAEFRASSTANLSTSLAILDFCSRKKIPLVYASSSAIYGNLDFGSDKSEEIELLSPYAADKYFLEQYANVANGLFELSSVGLRFFNVYGPRQDPSNPYSGVISIFVDRLSRGKPVEIFGGGQTRDFVYVKDVARALTKAMRIAAANCVCYRINVLSGVATSISNLYSSLAAVIPPTSEAVVSPMQPGDPMRSGGNTESMEVLLGLRTETMMTLENGLRATINYMSGATIAK